MAHFHGTMGSGPLYNAKLSALLTKSRGRITRTEDGRKLVLDGTQILFVLEPETRSYVRAPRTEWGPHAGALTDLTQQILSKAHHVAQSTGYRDLTGPVVLSTAEETVTTEGLEELKDMPEWHVPHGAMATSLVLDDLARKMLMAVRRRRESGMHSNIALYGETGEGKTSLVYHFARMVGAPLCVQQIGALAEPEDIFGRLKLTAVDGAPVTEWIWSPFAQACETEGAVILLDEATRKPTEFLNTLFGLLDDQRTAASASLPRPIRVAPGVTFWFTMNVGARYGGTYQEDDALQGRFQYKYETPALTDADEVKILLDRHPGLGRPAGERIRRFQEAANQLHKTGQIRKRISRRDALLLAEKTVEGFTLREAVDLTLSPVYSKEERVSLYSITDGTREV